MKGKLEKEVDEHFESVVEQIRCNNAFVYDEIKYIPFRDLSLINKIKTIYLHIRYWR